MRSSVLFTFFMLISTMAISQEFNGSFLGDNKEEILARHPELKSASRDTLALDRWYSGVEDKKEFIYYYGEVGGFPVKFIYWFYDDAFLEGIYDFQQNHPDPEKHIAVSSTTIMEILESKYGSPNEVVGNITVWKLFERIKYTIELMNSTNQSPKIFYSWNRRVESWHRKEIKEKSKDF